MEQDRHNLERSGIGFSDLYDIRTQESDLPHWK
jgi:hypothetical protein